MRFEVLNAGRESINSTDIAAIMQGELAPLAPDLVVYYEGATQFNLRSLVPNLPPQPSYAELMEKKQPSTFERALTDLAYSSALARRLQSGCVSCKPPQTVATGVTGEPTAPGKRKAGAVSIKR